MESVVDSNNWLYQLGVERKLYVSLYQTHCEKSVPDWRMALVFIGGECAVILHFFVIYLPFAYLYRQTEVNKQAKAVSV